MKVFFDTEFTGLHKDTSLISLGLVDEKGKTFYAEFLGYNADQVNDWIQKNVIDNLKHKTCIENWCNEDLEHFECVGYSYYVKTQLIAWLSRYDSVELVSDVCHYDMVLFIDIFGGAFDLPENVSPACHDINQDIARHFNISEREAFDKSREEIADTIQDDKHNALYDAMVIKNIYEKVI